MFVSSHSQQFIRYLIVMFFGFSLQLCHNSQNFFWYNLLYLTYFFGQVSNFFHTFHTFCSICGVSLSSKCSKSFNQSIEYWDRIHYIGAKKSLVCILLYMGNLGNTSKTLGPSMCEKKNRKKTLVFFLVFFLLQIWFFFSEKKTKYEIWFFFFFRNL